MPISFPIFSPTFSHKKNHTNKKKLYQPMKTSNKRADEQKQEHNIAPITAITSRYPSMIMAYALSLLTGNGGDTKSASAGYCK